jgi:hypothetical protein
VGHERTRISKSDLDVQSRDESSIKFHGYVQFLQIIHDSLTYI